MFALFQIQVPFLSSGWCSDSAAWHSRMCIGLPLELTRTMLMPIFSFCKAVARTELAAQSDWMEMHANGAHSGYAKIFSDAGTERDTKFMLYGEAGYRKENALIMHPFAGERQEDAAGSGGYRCVASGGCLQTSLNRLLLNLMTVRYLVYKL